MSSLQSKSVWQHTEFRFFSQYWPGYWPSSRRKLRSIYEEKKNGHTAAILTQCSSLFNKGFIIWPLLSLLYITRTLRKAVLESALLQWNPARRTPVYNGQFCLSGLTKSLSGYFSMPQVTCSHISIIGPSTGTLVICALSIGLSPEYLTSENLINRNGK